MVRRVVDESHRGQPIGVELRDRQRREIQVQAVQDRRAASSAIRSSVLIGVTCETTSTVESPWSAMIRLRARRTRVCTVSKLSPPGGVTLVSRSHWPCRSGLAALASPNVSPSQPPKSVSIRSSSTLTSSPSALAEMAAVS